ncbi:ABC transporter family substrate-binding protein [Dermabacteraceae bacterium P13264]
MRFTRRTLIGATAASVIGLAAAGCTKSGGKAGGQSADEKKELVNGNADINPQERDALADGGTVRLTINSFIPQWNLYHQNGNLKNTEDVMRPIFPFLVNIDAEGNKSPNPHYLKRMEQVSESPFVIEAELNEGMKWSDGTPLDYKSLENTFRVLSGKNKEYQIGSSDGYDKVSKVEQGGNDRTARVTFSQPYADWQQLLVAMPDAMAATPAAFNDDWVEQPKVTCGPFKIGSIDRANQSVTLVPDENWHGPKPKLQRLLWTVITDEAATVPAFKAGQLDSLEVSRPVAYTTVKDTVGRTSVMRRASGSSWTHFTLNAEEGRPLADKALRQAFFRAVPREEVFATANAVMPYPEGHKPLGNHIIMPGQTGYQDNSGDWAKYDVEAAKKILTDAGYTFDGEGRAVKDGQPVEITYVYNEGDSEDESLLPIIQESLAKAGITLKIQKVPSNDLFSKYVIPGRYDVTMFTWVGAPYLSSSDAVWRSDGGYNISRAGTPEVDKLIDASSQEADQKKRLELANQIDKHLWEYASVLPLWQRYTFQVQHPDLANYGAFGFQTPDWTNVGYVKGSEKAKS